MGFPGHDTTGWPALGDKAASTFHEGVISRLTDFEMGTSAPHAELQFVQYTMSTWPGFSGSPVFLPNGRVAAVHNMATPEEGRYKQIITIPHGIRSDCVLEMLVHHGLDGMVPFPFDKSKVQVERWTKVDARSAKAREDYVTASILVDEAEDLIYNKSKYSAGTEKCNEALKVLPSLARAHYVRSVACNSYYVDHGGVSEEEDLRLLGAAHKDAVKYTNMVPSDFLGILQVCRVLNNIGVATQNHENTRKSLTILNEVLTSKQLQPYERATAHSCRGQAVSNLGDKETALREHNEAIRLAPKSSSMLWNRSYYWRGIGRDDLADADVAKAREMDARPAASEAADLEKARKLGQTIVLVESKGKWYKAAIVKAEDARSFIHYIGYAETWDEWVTPDRIRSASK
jgi:tetratricopeptide (TPR) repeat protein